MNEDAAVSVEIPRAVGVDQRSRYNTMRLVMAAIFVISALVAAMTLPGDTAGGWGMFLTTLLFLQGITQFGVAFTAIMRLSGGFWARPLFRLAEVTTLVFMPISFVGILLVYFGARHQLFFWMDPAPGEHLSAWLGEGKLLFRALASQVVFYVVAFLYVRISLRPDIDQRAVAEATGLRRMVLALFGGAGGTADPEALTHRLYFWSVPVLIIAGLANTLISLDFAMMLWPHYHSTVFTMYYMIGCMFGGTALLLLLAGLQRRYINIDTVFSTRQIKNLGIIFTGFMCLWLYFFWAQFFVTWFGNLPNELRPLNAQMEGHYGPVFWTSVACLFMLPLAFLIFARVKRSLVLASMVALLICTGVWLNRYLMVLPAQWEAHVPFSTVGGAAGTIALVSGFLLLLLLAFDAFPMLSRWEVERIAPEKRASWHSSH
ncbi:MAG: hypothetical protein KJO54_04570 [Gammaproteobacteria bacterium]|nr:hypothetical protein [Gammaproteobacteria bacterium]NNM21095.1 hypothetical protein [Gammaproteobacteria bacterium]